MGVALFLIRDFVGFGLLTIFPSIITNFVPGITSHYTRKSSYHHIIDNPSNPIKASFYIFATNLSLNIRTATATKINSYHTHPTPHSREKTRNSQRRDCLAPSRSLFLSFPPTIRHNQYSRPLPSYSFILGQKPERTRLSREPNVRRAEREGNFPKNHHHHE